MKLKRQIFILAMLVVTFSLGSLKVFAADCTTDLQSCLTIVECNAQGGYWYDAGLGNQCHSIPPPEGKTYYIREDGGTINQCNGLVDAPYPGFGQNQGCALEHIYWLLPVSGNHEVRLKGGDTVVINQGSYEMGWYGPNHPDTSQCYTAWPYGCNMKPIPSGPSVDRPTRILGKGWDNGCSSPPTFWGAERAKNLISLEGSHNVEVRCLELTDHEDCLENQGSDGCPKASGGFPYGNWASGGITAKDSSNVLLEKVRIHGMAHTGIRAGRISNWELKDVVIRGNGFVGWDGDIGTDSSNNGSIKFIRTRIEYNGCAEGYPVLADSGPTGIFNCWSQNQGGYGDGLGTSTTNGNWYFEEVDFSHNVSDGLDLLYADVNGSVTIVRSRFEGNGGNQVKSAFDTKIEDTKIIGNCAYFDPDRDGIDPLVWNGGLDRGLWSGNCRALGNSIAASIKKPGQKFEIVNSTITGQGDVLIQTGGSACNGTEMIKSRDNIWVGGKEHFHDGYTGYYYAAGATGNGDGPCGTLAINEENSIVYNVKNNYCPSRAGVLCVDPLFNAITIGVEIVPLDRHHFDVSLSPLSPAIDNGVIVEGFDSLDFDKFTRDTLWDLGALEYNTCANGVLDINEQCDDGNKVSGDGCSDHCIAEYCGDRIYQAGLNEVCDTSTRSCITVEGYAGTQICNIQCSGFELCTTNSFCGDGVCNNPPESPSTCVTDCPYVCGDGLIHYPEECDDRNTVSGDGCSSLCVMEYCGDGIRQAALGEQCDDGNSVANDGCSANCLTESCGDRVCQSTENQTTCFADCGTTTISSYALKVSYTSDRLNPLDLANAVSAGNVYIFTAPDTSVSQVKFYLDDPNMVGVAKKVEKYAPFDFAGTVSGTTAYAYDSTQLSEGTHNITALLIFTDATTRTISANFTVDNVQICGDGLRERQEQCDDGNILSGDGCSATCVVEYCGDGIVHSGLGEQCDDANTVNGDGCNITCQTEYCGDGIINNKGVEQCDDSNTLSGDGCSMTCVVEYCGDGIVHSGLGEQWKLLRIHDTHRYIGLKIITYKRQRLIKTLILWQ